MTIDEVIAMDAAIDRLRGADAVYRELQAQLRANGQATNDVNHSISALRVEQDQLSAQRQKLLTQVDDAYRKLVVHETEVVRLARGDSEEGGA